MKQKLLCSALKCRAADNCDHHIDDDQDHNCKNCYPAHICPPHLLLHSASISFEGKRLALKMVCLVDKQFNPFTSFKHLSRRHSLSCCCTQICCRPSSELCSVSVLLLWRFESCMPWQQTWCTVCAFGQCLARHGMTLVRLHTFSIFSTMMFLTSATPPRTLLIASALGSFAK